MSLNLPGGTEEKDENPSHSNRPPGLDMNPGTTEYEAGLLTSQLLWPLK
jgi:hypothetical protein